MRENSSVSVRVIIILERFFDVANNEKHIQDASKKLIISLTGMLPGNDMESIDWLKHYSICLDDFFTEEEQHLLLDEYKAVVRYCFNPSEVCVNEQNADGLIISDSLLSLVKLNATPIDGSSVFLPFAGEGTFASLCSNCNVEGFEYNEYWSHFSNIVLNAFASKADISSSDFNESLIEGKKYDYIFSFPPLGMLTPHSADVLYKLITRHLNDNGEFLAILPSSFCNAPRDWFDIRKILYDYKDFSVTVYSLPNKILSSTSISFCLVRISKDKQNRISLVDVSSDKFIVNPSVRQNNKNNLDIEKIIDVVNNQDKRYVWKGHVDNLVGDLDLNPARYLLRQTSPAIPDGSNFYILKDICHLLPLRLVTSINESIPFIGMKDLSSSYMNCDIDYSDIKEKTDRNVRILDQNAFLVGFINGKFRVGRVTGLSKTNFISLKPEVFAISLEQSVVTEDFFLRCFLCEYTEQQAKALSIGSRTPLLHKTDFLDIEIIAPSLDDQIKICLEDSRKCLSESDRKILETHEEFRQDMHMKKHSIGQTIFNLNNWWDTLMKARKEGNGILSDSAFVGINHPIQVSNIYDILHEVICQLQQQIFKLDRGNGLVTENMSLTSFIEDYIQRKQSPIFKFVYDKARHHHDNDLPVVILDEEDQIDDISDELLFRKGDPIEYAQFAPEALEIIFDNIVSNACSHGFVGREENNLIKIELFSEETDYVITISNNGLPMNSEITEKYVFTYGGTTQQGHNHFGIGGYEVKKLMNEFDGDASIVLDSTSEFPVMYKLIFHNTNIIVAR